MQEEEIRTWDEIKEAIETEVPDWPQIRKWIQDMEPQERGKMMVDTAKVGEERIQEQIEMAEIYKDIEYMEQLKKDQWQRMVANQQ